MHAPSAVPGLTMGPIPGKPPGLLERDAELAAIARAVEHAAAGRGGLLVLEGPAGAGKSSLLAAAREHAEAEGFTVLRARAGQLERDFAYGVVRQLLEPVVGRAGLQPEGDQFAVLNGLYWQVADLAERAPLLVAIDDLHWCDAPSLRFVAFLARRVEGLPVLLAVAARRGEPGADEAILADLRADPLATVLEPAPLSVDGVAALLDEADAAPEFRAALHRSSAGNPLLVRELLHAVAAQRIAPNAAGAERLPDLGPEPIARFVAQRLRGLGAPAEALARALAVLGEDADLDLAAAVAALDVREAAGAADALGRMDVLEPGGGLRFAHPVVREAVYGGMTQPRPRGRPRRGRRPAQRPRRVGAAHRVASAARARNRRRRCPGHAARGGRAVRGRGAPDAAVADLRRALAEPMDGDERAGPAARARRRRAARQRARGDRPPARGPRPRRRRCHRAGQRALHRRPGWRGGGAARAGHRVVARPPGPPPAGGRADLPVLVRQRPRARGAPAPARPARRDRGRHPGRRVPARAPGLGRGARRPGRRAGVGLRPPCVASGFSHETHFPYYTAVSALIGLDELDQALGGCATATRWRGAALGLDLRLLVRELFALGRAPAPRNLAEAEVDARAGVEAVEASAMPGERTRSRSGTWPTCSSSAATDGALRLLEVPISRPASYQAMIRFHIRSRARLARGDGRGGLDDSLGVGARAERFGLENPAEVGWRSVAAKCLLALGEPERAHALATEELAYARRWGAPRVIGQALRLQGQATRGRGGHRAAARGGGRARWAPRGRSSARGRARRAGRGAGRGAIRRVDAREPLAEAALDASPPAQAPIGWPPGHGRSCWPPGRARAVWCAAASMR